VARAAVAKLARDVEELLELRLHRVASCRGVREQRLVRQAVIVIGERDPAVPDGARRAEAASVGAHRVHVVDVRERREARLGRLWRVAQHELRLTIDLTVEVGDADRLEHAADERVIALLILHPVLAGLERPRDLDDGLDVPVLQDLFDDVEVGHLLENTAVRAARREPELRDEGELVRRQPRLLGLELVDLRDDAGVRAHGAPVLGLDREGRARPRRAVVVERRVARARDDVDREQGRQPVLEREPTDVERIAGLQSEREGVLVAEHGADRCKR
jgi:hypothetical protein